LLNLKSIWFWQRFVSPHKSFLADELGNLVVEVNYVSNELMSKERKKMGWNSTKLKNANLYIKKNTNSLKKLVSSIPNDSVHLCQGIRSNGLVSTVQRFLKKQKITYWVFMEKVENKGIIGLIKRILYRLLLFKFKKNLKGILAIGSGSDTWYSQQGFNKKKIYPFAYFMSDSISKTKLPNKKNNIFKFIFVGQLIKRKKVDSIFKVLAQVKKKNFELHIFGDGPLKQKLKNQANQLLPGRVKWFGSIPIKNIPKKIASADCLLLPSRHDGWGSVVSESLMVGTQVICSDSCGASVAVKSSRTGGIFLEDNIENFLKIIKKVLRKGCITNLRRKRLKKWAKCLGAKEGAKYLYNILLFDIGMVNRPKPPWIKNDTNRLF